MYAITVCAHKFLHNLFVQLVAFYCDEIFFLFFITQRMRRFFCVLSRFNGMLKKSLIFARTFNANTSLWVHNVQCTLYTMSTNKKGTLSQSTQYTHTPVNIRSHKLTKNDYFYFFFLHTSSLREAAIYIFAFSSAYFKTVCDAVTVNTQKMRLYFPFFHFAFF